jgi:hypothetical protein
MNKVVAPSTVFLYKHRYFQTDTNISSWFVFLRSLRTIILHTNHISCYNGTWNLQKIIFVYINDWTKSFYLWLLQFMGLWPPCPLLVTKFTPKETKYSISDFFVQASITIINIAPWGQEPKQRGSIIFAILSLEGIQPVDHISMSLRPDKAINIWKIINVKRLKIS